MKTQTSINNYLQMLNISSFRQTLLSGNHARKNPKHNFRSHERRQSGTDRRGRRDAGQSHTRRGGSQKRAASVLGPRMRAAPKPSTPTLTHTTLLLCSPPGVPHQPEGPRHRATHCARDATFQGADCTLWAGDALGANVAFTVDPESQWEPNCQAGEGHEKKAHGETRVESRNVQGDQGQDNGQTEQSRRRHGETERAG